MKKLIPFSTIGAFVLSAIVVLVTGILFFGSGKAFSPSHDYVLFFDQSVNGLSLGSAIRFRGVEIGSVDRITLGGPLEDRPQVAVFVRLYRSSKLQEFRDQYDFSNPQLVRKLIDSGLKAQLLSQSILSGELYLSLDLHPEIDPHFVLADSSSLTEIPTIRSGLIEEFTAYSAELGDGLTQTLQKLQNVLSNVDAKLDPLTNESIATMKELREVMGSVKDLVDPNSPLGYQTPKTLEEIEKAAKAIRLLAEYLERNPSSILFGKSRVEVVDAK